MIVELATAIAADYSPSFYQECTTFPAGCQAFLGSGGAVGDMTGFEVFGEMGKTLGLTPQTPAHACRASGAKSAPAAKPWGFAPIPT